MGAQSLSKPAGRRLGLVVALAVEAKALGLPASPMGKVHPCADGHLAILSGMGPEAAANAGRALLEAGAEALLSVGTAGALRSDLQAGDLCIPRQILWQERAYSADEVLASHFLAQHPQARRENLLSLAQMLVDRQSKAAYAQQALAVDMESGALAALAAAEGHPFLALRVIVDSVDAVVPDAVRRGVDAVGNPRLPGFLWQLLRRPRDVPRLIRLGGQMQRAAITLRQLGRASEKGGWGCGH
ncbi:5'-methylthioadenosine nucleosidase [Acidithiobacillus sp. AMEEHan]|uniref:phosphorylase family protein n=1 Tax=Acidithiobacillus sp. AMEEHan TaxID=2994951 RepID=UPI0027E4FC61|nr:5'-methylthioadenosine nucleosidase [Acidithiobacillus sp. AMEEHan]